MQCTFCGATIARGTGKMYVKTDGRVFYFCSNKCEKNLVKLGRIPRESRWTAEHQRLKELAKSNEAKAERPAKTGKPKAEPAEKPKKAAPKGEKE